MKVEESFNDNHFIGIELSRDDIKPMMDKNSKYYGGALEIIGPKSDVQIILSIKNEKS